MTMLWQIGQGDVTGDNNKRSELLIWCFRPPAPHSRAVSPSPGTPQGTEAKKSVSGSAAESKPRIRRFVPDIQEIRVRYILHSQRLLTDDFADVKTFLYLMFILFDLDITNT